MKPRKVRQTEGKEDRFNTEIKSVGIQILFSHRLLGDYTGITGNSVGPPSDNEI